MDATKAFWFLLILVSLCLILYWHARRSAEILQKWADDNGFEILEKSSRTFLTGPFFFRASHKQTVYRVTVGTKTGEVRTGWVACGSYWWGLCLNQAQVRWDEVPQATNYKVRDRWLDD